MNPKVSIIIPIYNTEKYLPKCLDSVLNQTYHNLEIILVDDGSSDNSGKIADESAKKDKRITVLHQKNQGQSSARNNGIKKSTGDYISFIDSDDTISKTFIDSLLQPYLNDSDISLTVCGLRYNWLKTKTHNDVFLKPLRKRKKNESVKAYILYLLAVDGRLYSSVNKLYKAKVAKTIQFDEKLNFAEDTKFVLDYLKATKTANIDFVLKSLYIYNYGTETSTICSTSDDWKNWQSQYHNLKVWLDKNPTIKEKFWLHLVHLRWRISHFRAKRRLKR